MAVSTLLPNLSRENVGRVMQYLEWNVGNGFVGVPQTLTWPMLKQMRRDGFTIGSHTRSHVSLPMESEATAADELTESKRVLERRARRIDRSLRVSGRRVHARRGRGAGTDRLSLRVYRLPASRSTASRADHRAATALGGLVDRRRRPVLAGHSRMPGAGPLAAGPHVPAGTRMSTTTDNDRISRATRVLAAGRVPGLVVAFAIPLVLARVFDQTEFGTYKQLFLIYARCSAWRSWDGGEPLLLRAALSARRPAGTSPTRWWRSSPSASACVLVLTAAREHIANWLTNPALAPHLVPLGGFLALMLASAVLRDRADVAAQEHGGRVGLCGIGYRPGGVLRGAGRASAWGLRGVLAGAALFAAVRLAATLIVLWREFRSELRVDLPVLRRQLAYALPFALAVGIEVVHLNWHQYAVAARFDAAAFAIYAVGCLQIPVVDLIVSSTVNVMMVEMAAARERGPARRAAAVARHHRPAVLHDLPARRVSRPDGPRDHRRAVHGHV